jgi:CubicO group peptidase (beta-lactamase class C family)
MKKGAVHFSSSFGLVSKRVATAALITIIQFCASAGAMAQARAAGKDWPKATPKEFAIDAGKLAAFDADLASGKYGLVDSMLILRCGTAVFDKSYPHDYGQIYGERAKKEGPLNHDLHGPYNYFSTEFHPFYRGSDMHTMQSVSKTVTSITIGIARMRNEFTASLDAPIVQFFGGRKIANLDDRKKRITLRHLLTMTAGLEWHEELAYDDPKNSADIMEASRDWAQYVIDQPMANEPGKVFVYNSGATVLLAHIFKKVTGKNIDDYADEHLFKPLGMRFYWKHSPTGLPDTEGGLYLSAHDLAKIGQLFLKDGMWEGKEIVSAAWIKDSVTPHIVVPGGDWKYGYQWWMQPIGSSPEDITWFARGFGGQQLIVLPEYDIVAVFTGWDILPSDEKRPHDQLARILDSANRFFGCTE